MSTTKPDEGRAANPATPKRPYATPELRVLGKMSDLTQALSNGGTTDGMGASSYITGP